MRFNFMAFPSYSIWKSLDGICMIHTPPSQNYKSKHTSRISPPSLYYSSHEAPKKSNTNQTRKPQDSIVSPYSTHKHTWNNEIPPYWRWRKLGLLLLRTWERLSQWLYMWSFSMRRLCGFLELSMDYWALIWDLKLLISSGESCLAQSQKLKRGGSQLSEAIASFSPGLQRILRVAFQNIHRCRLISICYYQWVVLKSFCEHNLPPPSSGYVFLPVLTIDIYKDGDGFSSASRLLFSRTKPHTSKTTNTSKNSSRGFKNTVSSCQGRLEDKFSPRRKPVAWRFQQYRDRNTTPHTNIYSSCEHVVCSMCAEASALKLYWTLRFRLVGGIIDIDARLNHDSSITVYSNDYYDSPKQLQICHHPRASLIHASVSFYKSVNCLSFIPCTCYLT